MKIQIQRTQWAIQVGWVGQFTRGLRSLMAKSWIREDIQNNDKKDSESSVSDNQISPFEGAASQPNNWQENIFNQKVFILNEHKTWIFTSCMVQLEDRLETKSARPDLAWWVTIMKSGPRRQKLFVIYNTMSVPRTLTKSLQNCVSFHLF